MKLFGKSFDLVAMKKINESLRAVTENLSPQTSFPEEGSINFKDNRETQIKELFHRTWHILSTQEIKDLYIFMILGFKGF